MCHPAKRALVRITLDPLTGTGTGSEIRQVVLAGMMIADSTIVCPRCGYQATEHIPPGAWQFFCNCKGCGERLKRLPGDCCVNLREGPSLQLKNLIGPGHFDASVGKMCRELPHSVFFTVNEERAFCAGLLLPSQQLGLVGMAGETINGVDASPNWNILTKNAHLLLAVDNTARERPKGCIADEHDARLRAREIVLEVMTHAAAGAHARTGHDDGPAMDVVYRNRIGGLPREMQSWQSKWVVSLLKQLGGRWLKALRMASKDFRG